MTHGLVRGGAQMRLEIKDASHVGACRRVAQDLAGAWQLDATAVGRVGIVATELATNLIRHAGGGEILVQPIHYDGRLEIELLSIDRGSGMPAEQALVDGYSTGGGGAGNGLGAVRRLSAAFDLYSQPQAGSVVFARVGAEERGRHKRGDSLELGAISVAMRGELECGDTWALAADGARHALLLVDGLGHGTFAAVAATAAAVAFAEAPLVAPEETMRTLHRKLAGTRGAAAACALLDTGGTQLRYAGVGNISGTLVEGETQRGLMSYNGTLGVRLTRARQLEYPWSAHSVLVLHSDGLSARWSLAAYPGLLARHAAVVAAVLYRDQVRDRDDATIVVARAAA